MALFKASLRYFITNLHSLDKVIRVWYFQVKQSHFFWCCNKTFLMSHHCKIRTITTIEFLGEQDTRISQLFSDQTSDRHLRVRSRVSGLFNRQHFKSRTESCGVINQLAKWLKRARRLEMVSSKPIDTHQQFNELVSSEDKYPQLKKHCSGARPMRWFCFRERMIAPATSRLSLRSEKLEKRLPV
jgi:hypothetical protein